MHAQELRSKDQQPPLLGLGGDLRDEARKAEQRSGPKRLT